MQLKDLVSELGGSKSTVDLAASRSLVRSAIPSFSTVTSDCPGTASSCSVLVSRRKNGDGLGALTEYFCSTRLDKHLTAVRTLGGRRALWGACLVLQHVLRSLHLGHAVSFSAANCSAKFARHRVSASQLITGTLS